MVSDVEIETKKKVIEERMLQRQIALNQRAGMAEAIVENFGDEGLKVLEKELERDIRNWISGVVEGVKEKNGRTDLGVFEKMFLTIDELEGFEYEIEKIENKIEYKFTKCPIFELAKAISQTKWGYFFFCKGDYFVANEFNPNIELTRTKTLMQGDDCCNHCYTYNDDSPE